MGRWEGWALVLAAWGSVGSGLSAQEAQLVVPGDGTLALDRLAAFDAIYEQVGIEMLVRFSKTEGSPATWDLVMQMPAGGGGAGIDHIGHRAEDFGFAYRRFGFGAFRNEYLEAEADGETVRLRRLVRDGQAAPSSAESPTAHPVMDGTAMFWALGLLPLEVGRRYRLPTWNPTSDGLEIRETAVFEVTGQRSYDLGGVEIPGHVIVAHAGSGQVEMLVTPHPPFLLEQTALGEDGSRSTIVSARSVTLPERPEDEAAIREAGTAFSSAYGSGDTAAVRRLYTPDAELFPPDRTVRGADAIVRYFSPVPGRTIVEHRMETETLDVERDVAIEVGTWRQTLRRGPDASLDTASGAYLIEWRKGLDGAWRIRRDMWHRGGD